MQQGQGVALRIANIENEPENFSSQLIEVLKNSYPDGYPKNKNDFIFITAPENVAWLLNIRGYDNPNSPIPNCRLLISDRMDIFLISEKKKAKN